MFETNLTKAKLKTIYKKILSWYTILLQVKKHLIFQKFKILIIIIFKKYLNHTVYMEILHA